MECGAFGCAADWHRVQEALAGVGVRSLAYDRAGLGLSDPGPDPRDGRAIADDLEAMLERLEDPAPMVLAGHSMAGLFLRILAPRVRDRLMGLVLVDAVTPEAVDHPAAARMIDGFRRAMFLLDRVADLGVMRPWSLVAGDRIGLPPEISREKRRIYASASHARASAREVQQWMRRPWPPGPGMWTGSRAPATPACLGPVTPTGSYRGSPTFWTSARRLPAEGCRRRFVRRCTAGGEQPAPRQGTDPDAGRQCPGQAKSASPFNPRQGAAIGRRDGCEPVPVRRGEVRKSAFQRRDPRS